MRNDEKNNYRKALVEVEAVINSLNEDEYKKIPQNLINQINENKDNNYIYEYNKELSLDDWIFMPETKALLYNILKRYLFTDKQKCILADRERLQALQIEKEKSQKYNMEDIFRANRKSSEK